MCVCVCTAECVSVVWALEAKEGVDLGHISRPPKGAASARHRVRRAEQICFFQEVEVVAPSLAQKTPARPKIPPHVFFSASCILSIIKAQDGERKGGETQRGEDSRRSSIIGIFTEAPENIV